LTVWPEDLHQEEEKNNQRNQKRPHSNSNLLRHLKERTLVKNSPVLRGFLIAVHSSVLIDDIIILLLFGDMDMDIDVAVVAGFARVIHGYADIHPRHIQ
jgi:hypothetical protein